MSETLNQLQQLEVQIAECESSIRELETLSKDHLERSRQADRERHEWKKKLEGLRALLQNSKVRAKVQSEEQSAAAARQLAEKANSEAQATLARLTEKEQTIDEKLKQLDEALAKQAE